MTLLMLFSVASPMAITASAKTTSKAYRIVNVGKNNYISHNSVKFQIKNNHKVKVYASDLQANGQSYYNLHALSNNCITIMRELAEFDYVIINKKGKVVAGGTVKNGGTINIKNNWLSTCTLRIVSRYINDGKNVTVMNNGKQRLISKNGRDIGNNGCYWIEY